MKVKDLKKLLDKLDDEMLVVVRSSDHHYENASFFKDKAVSDEQGDLSEPGIDSTNVLTVLVVE